MKSFLDGLFLGMSLWLVWSGLVSSGMVRAKDSVLTLLYFPICGIKQLWMLLLVKDSCLLISENLHFYRLFRNDSGRLCFFFFSNGLAPILLTYILGNPREWEHGSNTWETIEWLGFKWQLQRPGTPGTLALLWFDKIGYYDPQDRIEGTAPSLNRGLLSFLLLLQTRGVPSVTRRK